MPLISRLSSWFGRMFDMSEGDDVFEEEGAEGFLMTGSKEAPPVLPQLQTRPVTPPVQPPAFRPPSARPVTQTEPAVAEAQAFAPQQDEDDEPDSVEPVVDEDVVETVHDSPVVAEQPDALQEEPARGEMQSLPATDPVEAQAETSVVQADSVDDMLTMFRATSTATESAGLTKHVEDVTAADLLVEARDVRDLLVSAGSNTDNVV